MSRLPRYAVILALSLCCAAFPFAAHSQTKAPKKAPASTVAGRVTIHGKGAPGIVVSMRKADYSPLPQPSFKATTDQEGSYRIIDVPPGNYEVLPLSPAFVWQDQSPFRGRGKSLLLAEAENVEGIDFSIERGGVITGKVTDADGRPVVEERLSIVPAEQANQQGQRFGPLLGPNVFQTDDRGIYRIYGIPAGRYKIFVGQSDDNYYAITGPGRVRYRRTFYPDATDPNDARILEVTEGSEAGDIDIRFGRSLPSFAVSGRVVDGETGKPMPGLRFALRRVLNDGYANINSSVSSNSQGEFRLENVIPGKYAVQILPMPSSEVRADPVTLEVVDQDVTGIVVKTAIGLSISGTVAIDGRNDAAALAKLPQLRLYAFVRDEGSPGSYGQSSQIGADGSFRIGGLGPGLANFSVGSQDNMPQSNFTILRLERDGIAQSRGIEISAGEQVTGVKIVLKYGTGSVRGEVKFENGQLPAGGRVTIWLRRADEGASTRGDIRPYSLDARGHFLIEGVAAGNYELNVNMSIPGSRKPMPPVKQPVTVAEGAVSDVTVTLDLGPSTETPAP